MKNVFAILSISLLIVGCGSDTPIGAGGTPPASGDGLAITANFSNGRALSKAEAKSLMTQNFATITRYEVGMKWREESKQLNKSDDGQSYCYSQYVIEYEITQILPAGSATNVQGDALMVKTKNEITPLEGELCTGELGVADEYESEYEMENWAASETVDSLLDGFERLQNIQIGTFENRETVKGTVVFEGKTITFLDFIDQPSLVGSRFSHFVESFAGKSFEIVTQGFLLN